MSAASPTPDPGPTPDERAPRPDERLAPADFHRYGLRERVRLTYRYHGPRALLLRAITFPLRFTPLRSLVDPKRRRRTTPAEAIRWYQAEGRPVSVVIPSYRDLDELRTLVASIRRTTRTGMVRIIVADDASGPEHVAQLRTLDGVEVVAGETNTGFAANVTYLPPRQFGGRVEFKF